MPENEAPEQIVQKISIIRENRQKALAFLKLEKMLEHSSLIKNKRVIIPLLYDRDASIRLETAFWVERLGLALQGQDYARYLFSLQDFSALLIYCASYPQARSILFNGFKDKNLRLRTRLLKIIHERDCQNMKENMLYFYGRGDYESLVDAYFNSNETDRAFLLDLLHQGTKEENNVPYHRRQCALLLEKLWGAEELDETIQELLKPLKKIRPKVPLQINREPIKTLTALDLVVDKLERHGLWIEGQLVFPQLNIGPATGRITYRNPGIQTWPSAKRLQSLKPPDKELLIYDYKSIEPMILLNILLDEHLISLADIPEQDIYLAINPEGRGVAKRFLNSLINGGPRRPDFKPGPFFWKLLPALDELRAELWMKYNQTGVVETVMGRKIPLDKKEPNLSGKIMNRLIQGSAADFFNHAIIKLDAGLVEEGEHGRIYFLLFDEVWISTRASYKKEVSALALTILNTEYKHFHFVLPVLAEQK